MTCVDLGVARAEALERVVVLPVALGAMGLHQRPGFLGETSEPGQHLVGARRREPGRDDRPDQASTSVDRSDIGDRPTARVDPRDRIVISVEIRRAGRVIHRHAADERPLTLRNAGLVCFISILTSATITKVWLALAPITKVWFFLAPITKVWSTP